MCVVTATVAGSAAAAMMINATIAASAISGAVGVFSAVQQSRAANKQSRYMSKVAENNAKAAQYEAQHAKRKASDDAAQQRQNVRRFIGSQRAGAGAAGAVVDKGSFLDLTLDTAEQGKLDELAILYQGDMNAYHLESQAAGYEAQAEGYKAQQTSPLMAGVTAGVKGAAQTGMSYYSMTRVK